MFQLMQLWGGVPAKILKMRFSDDIITRLIKSEWWDLPVEKLHNLPFDDIEKCLEILELNR